jgi:uncharacterized protein YbjT (DUF2867 family)
MKVLLTGANGYIGQRLIPVLLEAGHTLYCCVRNRARFEEEHQDPRIVILEIDFLSDIQKVAVPIDIDVAYFLMHSMSSGADFEEKETKTARQFLQWLRPSACQQIIYLSGIVNDVHLSKHLHSRLAVERTLNSGSIPVTTLRAGIIVGSGSASFEIIRDLVEKLPVMVTPKWLNTLCQPIAIRNVIQFLSGVALKPAYYGHHFDIGGPEPLSYKQMLLQFASVRGLKRWILTLPVMTPRLSSYWLYFITSTSYPLAVNLVNSMKIPVVCSPNNLAQELDIQLISYRDAVMLAFQKIEQNRVISSWKDAFAATDTPLKTMEALQVPTYGCFTDIKWRVVSHESNTLERIWRIGGQQGWYYGNWLWKLRGLMDKLVGGVGLRRGRRSEIDINPGDALDFWRVLVADRKERRLLLYAEMKLPGEAWLEFKMMKKNHQLQVRQTATFRPKGVWGRLYWYSVLPFHFFIFNGMIEALVKQNPSGPFSHADKA